MSNKLNTAKQPFLPLFFGDFLAATSEWEGEEQALYLLLLGYQWSLGSLPSDLRKLCRLVRFTEAAFYRSWPQVSVKFVDTGNGRLVNSRLEEHRAKTLQLSEKNSNSGKKGAEARWRNNGERHTDDMANATNSDGERHKSANGVTDGNPSHPIPSHPILSHPIPTQSQSREVRASRLPDDFALTDERKKIAEAERIDPGRTFAKFCDYWRAASGAKARKTDWDATWRNWCRNEHDQKNPSSGTPLMPALPPELR